MSGYSLEYIVQTYQKQMLFVANRILHNLHDAEDAVQTALLRISQQCYKLPEHEEALRAYVLTAARNAALDLLPKQSKEVDIDRIITVGSDDLFEKLATTEDYHRLLAAIDRLPIHYREVLMLRYVQDLETKQMAKLLNRPRSTIQKQIARAKAMLMQFCEKEEYL